MISDLISILRCPVCRAGLSVTPDGKSALCTGNRPHCFDFSKSGYLNLAGPKPGEGDLKDAVAARSLFLGAGYYQPLSDKINGLLSALNCLVALDAGCGEGYYTNRAAEVCQTFGFDLSKAGIEHAAKQAKKDGLRSSFAVASLYEMPVADGSADVVMNLFAPCAENEFRRVLRPGGHLILVGAGKNHLMGLKQALYDRPYQNPGREDLPVSMTLTDRQTLSGTITVKSAEHVRALFSMTPYYWRTSMEDRRKLDGLDSLTTEFDFDVYVFRKDLE